MVKMVLHHQSAEEDMLISQSSLGKSNKDSQEKGGGGGDCTCSDGNTTIHKNGDGSSTEVKRKTEGQLDESVSVTHEIGFGIGTDCSSKEVSFRVRELAIRNPDECFGEDAKADTTGLNLWGAAVVLARWMADPAIRAQLEGKTVLELGAGCGAG